MGGASGRAIAHPFAQQLDGFAADQVANRFGRFAASLAIYQHKREAPVRPFHHLKRVATLTGGIFAGLRHAKMNFHSNDSGG